MGVGVRAAGSLHPLLPQRVAVPPAQADVQERGGEEDEALDELQSASSSADSRRGSLAKGCAAACPQPPPLVASLRLSSALTTAPTPTLALTLTITLTPTPTLTLTLTLTLT